MNAPHERLISLWRAVIAQAVQDVCHPEIDAPTPEERVVAYEWLTSDSEAVYSYKWACDVSDIEPDFPRRRMREMGVL
jgi:hypothetical protein